MNIGIYGGTFNPIHKGHLHVMEEFFHILKLDQLILMPACVPPHKAAADLAPAGDRLAMCRLGAEETDIQVLVSDMEILRDEKSYTADTLRALRALYPDDRFYLLMGEDMFLTVDRWYDAETIFDLAVICASPRSPDGRKRMTLFGNNLAQKCEKFRFVIADIPFWDISSTQIRKGESEAVPPSVLQYIRTHRLYGAGEMGLLEAYKNAVKPFLSPTRYAHSLAVADEAARLASRYGADPQKARIAGVLHDIMKEAPPDLQLKTIADFGILLSDIERITPKLWHQRAAMAYVKTHLGVRDPDILNAIRYHTSGRKGMSLLEKVVFIADFTSRDRDYRGVSEMRRMAEISLEEAMVEGLSFVIIELSQGRKPIIQDTFEAYNEALMNRQEGSIQ